MKMMLASLTTLGLILSSLTFAQSKTPPQKTATPPASNNPRVIMETSKGVIEIELFADKAPISTKNFLSYVSEHFYDGTIFHRVIDNFMIQGGGFTPDMKEKKAKKPIKNEAGNGLKNKRGSIAMARTSDVDSASAQFFINVRDNDFLDHKDNSQGGYGYAVFGQVIKGLEVVDAIKTAKTGTRDPHGDVPLETIVIKSVQVAKK